MKTGLLLAVLAVGLTAVAATCPNLCSQHGTCGENDRCTCFSNWQGADCSERVCPYGLAWVDAPSATNEAHWYAECSNKGVCDRTTGECACYAGYEGKGCRRASCPNDCSGHGTCYYLEQLKASGGKFVVDYGTPSTGRNDKKWYDLWDKSKIQGCVCDPYYEGTDCSLRQCPRGDNRLTTGSRTGSVTDSVDQGNTHQEIFIGAGNSDATDDATMMGGEFTLTFRDLYGGVWETDPIQLHSEGGNSAAWTGTGGSPAYVAGRIEAELENLPNQVIEDVTVTNIPCGRGPLVAIAAVDDTPGIGSRNNANMYTGTGGSRIPATNGIDVYAGSRGGSYLGYGTGLQTALSGTQSMWRNGDAGTVAGLIARTGSIQGTETTGDWAYIGECWNFMVEFNGDQNAGVQNLLEVNYKGCNYNGCAPHYTGITDGTDPTADGVQRITAYVEDVTQYVVSGSSNTLIHKESAVCSEHGLCDTTTGLCSCFSGYYDEDCNKQTVLV